MEKSHLFFFTPNHAQHSNQWLQKGSQHTLVCFACFVEIIENKNEPSIRKTRALQELLNLVSNGNILKILATNESVLAHLLHCLWEMTDSNEDNTTENVTSVEIIFQLCCALKSDAFVDKVVECVSQKLSAKDNINRVTPQLNLLGKLLQKIPGLIEKFARCRQNILAYIASSTSFPDERVRSSLFFILTLLYRNKQCSSNFPEGVTETVFRECCEVLTSATSKELQINSVALLQSMTRPGNLPKGSQIITSNMERLTTGLKKAFLSRNELVQSFAVECLNNLVLFDEGIISSDLTGFLFEVFRTKNEPLLAQGFQSISQLVEKKEFYNKGHVLYGFETIVSALMTAAKNRHTKLVKQGFGVLAKVLGNCPVELSLVTGTNVLSKCLDVMTAGLSSLDEGVVHAGCCCFSLFLERRHFAQDVPYVKLLVLVEGLVEILGKICKGTGHWGRVENKDLQSSMLATILEVIKRSLDLATCSKNEPPSLECLLVPQENSTMREAEEFLSKLLQLCDQGCIPHVIANFRKFYGTTVPRKFFELLNKLLCVYPEESKEMSRKFVASSFIRIALDTKAHFFGKRLSNDLQTAVNNFLELICRSLLPAEIEHDLGNMFNSLTKVNSTAQELLQVLKQNSTGDEALRNAQECILLLFHLAYQNGDRMVSSSQLIHALTTFLVLNPTCFERSTIATKCLIHLYVTQSSRTVDGVKDTTSLQANAQRILVDGISKYGDRLDTVYFHDFALVEWAVGMESMNPAVKKEILELWFSHGSDDDLETSRLESWKAMADKYSNILLTLASILTTSEVAIQSSILAVLQSILSRSKTESSALKATLKDLKLALQKLFLDQAVEPLADSNLESILKLLQLLVTSVPDMPLDDDFIKLVYHVVNLLQRSRNSTGLSTYCLNFVNTCVAQDCQNDSDKVVTFLLKHHDYNKFLENITESSQDALHLDSLRQRHGLLSTALVSISYLTHFQEIFGIPSQNILEITVETALSLLWYTASPLVQFAANIFWTSILQANQSFSNVALRTESKLALATTTSGQQLSKAHLRMILVRLQNSVLESNPLVQASALRCLDALLSRSADSREILEDPWNKAMLREVKDNRDSSHGLSFCLRLYSLFLYHKRTRGLVVDFPVVELVRNALERFPDYEFDTDPNGETLLLAYAEFFREVIQTKPDALSSIERSNLKRQMENLTENYREKDLPLNKGRSTFINVQELFIHEDFIYGKRKDPLKALNELLDLLK